MKKRLRGLLAEGRFDDVAELAADRKRVLGDLVSLTYDSEALIAWRAVEAVGLAAARVADSDPDFVRSHLRRLHWLLSEESGGICWYAPQAMAEIIRQSPGAFAEYASIVVTLLLSMNKEDLTHFRPGILWAIARLAPVAGDEVDVVLPHVSACLESPDPQVRGMAVWCLAQAGELDSLAGRPDLLSDDGPVDLYRDGQLGRTSVGALASG